MKNAFSRIGSTCVLGVLIAGTIFAGSVDKVTVTLPHAVTVGATTLPSGEYTFTSVDMNDGNAYFVMRSDRGEAIALSAQKIDPQTSDKSEVTLQKDGDAWHLDKIFIAGSATGFQFADQK
jgi:hypothetical protein